MTEFHNHKPPDNQALIDRARVLVIVEGTNDIEFLRRISLTLHVISSDLPNLAEMEQQGQLIFVPFGGNNLPSWTHRFAALGKPEFFLLDHEVSPETESRQEAAEIINRRPGCRAIVTRKRSLENYLHPDAIRDAGKIDVTFGDFDPVGTVVAKALFESGISDEPWELLSRRSKSRLTSRAKRWLNTTVASQITAEFLEQRDPDGEIASWLTTIGQLAHSV
ncbi:ATP-dependent endonuclease [Bremerella sp. T1]|uniref:ATP-dependent endonuclease n=1 Tax=Bremerella sp. TYQ1 TaxID=3119568 RepID=UPI001CCD0C65|nr:ATP-dependent endonuclease [Bremerella volcania]UBM36343.1 ATP-dependent endonuclease [Bremerella volcania]